MSKQPDAIQKILESVTRNSGSRLWEVFRDWMECCAISISNTCDLEQQETREAVYMGHAGRYGKENMVCFAQALAKVIEAFEGPEDDVLGKIFMGLEFGEKQKGQFFTPYHVSRLMAGITLEDGELARIVAEKGFVTLSEPACGSGGMVVAYAAAMRAAGLNPQQQLHVTGVDVDLTAIHMAYVQISLLGIPAVLLHGNTLSLETRSTWRTPFHMLYGWEWKRKHGEPEALEAEPAIAQPEQEQPAQMELSL